MQDKFKDWPLVNMQAQEVFDTAAEHLLTQMERSVKALTLDFPKKCAYRTPEGLKCAAGPFIPDSVYDDSFEGSSWLSLESRNKVPGVHAGLIYMLQYIHDEEIPTYWYEHLERLAKRYNFNKTKLEKYKQVQS